MGWCGSYMCKIDSLNGLILSVKFHKVKLPFKIYNPSFELEFLIL